MKTSGERLDAILSSSLDGIVVYESIRDELGVNVLTQLLNLESFGVNSTPRINVNDVFALVEKTHPDVVCIAVVAPFVLSHTRYLCSKLRQRMPKLPIVIGLWGFSNVAPETLEKLNSAGATKITTSLSQTCTTLQEMRSVQ